MSGGTKGTSHSALVEAVAGVLCALLLAFLHLTDTLSAATEDAPLILCQKPATTYGARLQMPMAVSDVAEDGLAGDYGRRPTG